MLLILLLLTVTSFYDAYFPYYMTKSPNSWHSIWTCIVEDFSGLFAHPSIFPINDSISA